MNRYFWSAIGLMLFAAAPLTAADSGMTTGTPDIKSAGPLAFGPDGILFIGDPKGAAIFAIDTKDTAAGAKSAELALEGIDTQVAGLLGTTADDIFINDLAVNPASGAVYLSIARGRGPDAAPVLVRVDESGELKHVPLENVAFSKTELANAPEDRESGEGRRRGNQRLESITDLMFLDGRLYVAGLSNEEFASKLRSIAFPFQNEIADTSIEIFHGSHGQYETRSPVRTFAVYNIDDEAELAGGVHLHAAGEDSARIAGARRKGHGPDRGRARQSQSPARHGRLSKGWPGLSAHGQQRPRPDEDLARRRFRRRTDQRARERQGGLGV